MPVCRLLVVAGFLACVAALPSLSLAGERPLPERVEFKPDNMPEGIHTIDAEVLEFIYMGDLFRTRLRVAGSDDFVIKARNGQGQRVLRPGEKIKVGWHPQDARALDP